MNKKTAIAIFILVLIFSGGGFLLWQNSKAAVKDLNATLPEGVRVVKSLFGNEYRVVNKIDGYEFKVPIAWEGLKEIGYLPESSDLGYLGASLNFEGKEGLLTATAIDRIQAKEENLDLEQWTKKAFETFGLVGNLSLDKIGDIEIIKAQEN